MIDNRENNIWTVYIHIVPKSISGYDYDKYYVGITSKSVDFRWKNNGYGYVSQKFFYKAIQKYGWNNIEHYIIAEHLTEDEAKKFEKTLIKELDCNANKGRHGYNITDGGDGLNGYIMPEDERKRRSLSYSGKGNPYYGKKHTKEIRLKMSKNHADFSGGNHPHAKKFYQFDINGKYITIYGSVKEAAKAIGVTDGINRGARKHKPSCGYLWGYEKDIIIIDNIPQLKYTYKEQVSKNFKHVYMFDSNKKFIKDYISCGEAGRDNNLNRICIACAARKWGKCGNFYWRYENGIGFDENNRPILLDKSKRGG